MPHTLVMAHAPNVVMIGGYYWPDEVGKAKNAPNTMLP